jgi:hypothetical protein
MAGRRSPTTSDDGIWIPGSKTSRTPSRTFTTADADRAFRYFCSQHAGRVVRAVGTIMVM